MQVKKYFAQDMQEAVRMIKEDLGSRAVILSTRKVRKGTGAFGLFGKYVLEVTAAQDEGAVKPAPKPSRLNNLAKAQAEAPVDEYRQEISNNAPDAPRRQALNSAPFAGYSGLAEDIGELKDLVADLRQGVRRERNDEANVAHLR